MSAKEKIAVILFNLGGPDNLDAVKPFLFNLFNDPAIITLPNPLRWLLAKRISSGRAPVAREIYAQIGGKSPLLEQTQAQARALETQCADRYDLRAFPAMRYWHPMADQTITEVAAWGPDRIVLLPLYPQFSTTTTGSSLTDWERTARASGLSVPTHKICCYPWTEKLITAHAHALGMAIDQASGPTRVLFSAHGLPEKFVAGGDPYQWQIEGMAERIVGALDRPELDWRVCYQSRVGRLKWIGPSTEDEIATAGRDGMGLIVLPLAFVSEHSETLVELDIEYRELAQEKGVPAYHRIPALGCDEQFIAALGEAVDLALEKDDICSHTGHRLCPADRSQCPAQINKAAHAS